MFVVSGIDRFSYFSNPSRPQFSFFRNFRPKSANQPAQRSGISGRFPLDPDCGERSVLPVTENNQTHDDSASEDHAAVNFDALVVKAFAEPDEPAPNDSDDEAPAPPISIEDLDHLWSAFLKLDEWIFLVQPAPGKDPFPFIGMIDEQPWLFLFTDHERLRRFADRHDLLDLQSNAHFITMTPDQSLEWLRRLHAATLAPSAPAANPVPAVYGIRINEGPRGWYAPLESLPAIYGHLKELGRI